MLIVGGGFGGIYAARHLGRAPVDVTVLDRGTSNVFQPLLYQCATGLLSEGQISSPIRALLKRQRNATVLQGEALDVDPARRRVIAARPDGSRWEISYDYLIVAAGMRQSYFGHDEYAHVAPGMKTIDDALAIRRRLFGAFEIAETLPTAEQRAPWLTFAVVGAGPTGVELAGQIREVALRTIRKEFRTIDPSEARVLLFDAVPAPLLSFGPRLSQRAAGHLEKLGIELHMGVHIADVSAEGVVARAADGTSVSFPARTTLWTAGVEAVPFARRLASALGVEPVRSGRLPVNADLTVRGHSNVWVVGDVASLEDLPGVAEVAMQGGIYAAKEIRRRLVEDPRVRRPFRYHDLGQAAYIARYRALVKVGPLQLSGFIGWIMWGLIHLAFLAGVRNRVAALLSWLIAIARNSRDERALLFRDPLAAPDPYVADRMPVRSASAAGPDRWARPRSRAS